MDGNDPLEALLTQIMKNADNLQKLKKELDEREAQKVSKPVEPTAG